MKQHRSKLDVQSQFATWHVQKRLSVMLVWQFVCYPLNIVFVIHQTTRERWRKLMRPLLWKWRGGTWRPLTWLSWASLGKHLSRTSKTISAHLEKSSWFRYKRCALTVSSVFAACQIIPITACVFNGAGKKRSQDWELQRLRLCEVHRVWRSRKGDLATSHDRREMVRLQAS